MSLFEDVEIRPRHQPNYHVTTFYAHGMPKPQGSKRGIIHRHTGRAVVIESNNAGQKDWRATVASAALDAHGAQALLDGPLRVRLVFAVPRPKSHPKKRRTWPTARPDIDKLTRAVLDSCTHVIWRDDSQVVDLHVAKIWAEIDTPSAAGVAVAVIALTPQGEQP